MVKRKFIQYLPSKTNRAVEKEAKKRGVTKQEIIRAVMVPEWLEKHGDN